jgi:Nucleotidyltransferase domain
MPIPESQLMTWSNVGAQQSAANTYNSVKTTLENSVSKLQTSNFEVYLQGSYRNATNIRGDSDVDVIVQLRDTYGYDISALTATQKTKFDLQFAPAQYSFQSFRENVERALHSYYGTGLVEARNKCLIVKANAGRLNADVVPCTDYRLYQPRLSPLLPSPVIGIEFYTRYDNRLIVNYPKLHYENGTTKNAATSQRYKPVVRVFKNLRNNIVSQGALHEATAPSYFIECLLYNSPNYCFKQSLSETMFEIFKWMANLAPSSSFGSLVCGNGVVPLFGPTAEQWNQSAASAFIIACVTAWNNW